MGLVRHSQACPRCAEIAMLPYFHNDLSYCFEFLQASKGPLELQINCFILGGHGQVHQACLKYSEIANFQYLSNELSYCFDFLQASKVH